jgi:hypothetical protein
MNKNDCLSLQANVICLLLALIGATAIIKHPGWFGSVTQDFSSAARLMTGSRN